MHLICIYLFFVGSPRFFLSLRLTPSFVFRIQSKIFDSIICAIKKIWEEKKTHTIRVIGLPFSTCTRKKEKLVYKRIAWYASRWKREMQERYKHTLKRI